MPGLVYAQDGRTQAIYLNLYVTSETAFEVAGGTIGLAVDSEMPYGDGGRVSPFRHRAVPERSSSFACRVGPGTVRRRVELYHYLDRLDACAGGRFR